MCQLKICLFGIKIILRLIIFKEQQTHKSSEKRAEVTVLLVTFTFKRETSTWKGISLSVPGNRG